MTKSRWSSWSRGTTKRFGFNAFTEAAMPSQDPAEKARQMGLVGMPFGWFKDPNTGQLVARSIGGELVMYDNTPTGPGGGTGPLDTGNPTNAASGVTPADRARQMGLQSDGSGNYVDSSGQTVARTVNNELVFYDPRGSGGSIADGSGGAQLTQSAPSWVDPVSGLIIVPPAQPESPEEINSVPDPTPATAPMGYDKFVEKKRLDMHKKQKIDNEVEQDIQQKAQRSNEIYQSSEQLQSFKQEMDGIVQDAMQKGGDKAGIGSYLMDHLADNAEQIAGWYELLADNPEADDIIITHAIDKARYDWYTENYEGDEEKMQEHDVVFTSQSPEEVRPLQKKATEEKIKGNNEQTVSDYQSTLETDGIKYKQYSGQSTVWDVFETELPDNRPEKSVFSVEDDVKGIADEILSDTGFGEADTQVFEVSWEAAESAEGEDPKSVALDSLSTYRNQVLPDLPIGAILYSATVFDDSNRNSGVRERIYKLAGFGDYDYDFGGQAGVVTMDENGKKKIMPINRTNKTMESYQADRINEQLLSMLDHDLNTEERDSLFSALFDGFI